MAWAACLCTYIDAVPRAVALPCSWQPKAPPKAPASSTKHCNNVIQVQSRQLQQTRTLSLSLATLASRILVSVQSRPSFFHFSLGPPIARRLLRPFSCQPPRPFLARPFDVDSPPRPVIRPRPTTFREAIVATRPAGPQRLSVLSPRQRPAARHQHCTSIPPAIDCSSRSRTQLPSGYLHRHDSTCTYPSASVGQPLLDLPPPSQAPIQLGPRLCFSASPPAAFL